MNCYVTAGGLTMRDGDYNGGVDRGKQVVFVIDLPASVKSSAAVNPVSHYKVSHYYKAR